MPPGMVLSIVKISLVFFLFFGGYSASPLTAPSGESAQAARRDPLLERLAPLMDPPEYNAGLGKRTAFPTSAVTSAVLSTYDPFTHMAAATYCVSNVTDWKCGEHCDEVPGMIVYGSGGDNEEIPFWYVGYLPSMNSAVVAHRGTHPTAVESDFIDVDTFLNVLNGAFFPGVSALIMAHEGFANAHGRTFDDILSNVKKVMLDHSVTKVIIVGHSLGGAIAVFDAVALQLALPSRTQFTLVTYGQPRVGNQEFANYIDAHFPGHVRITHALDPVPTVPGKFLGFTHSAGELHIDGDGLWNACSGQDNTARPKCSSGAVAFVWDAVVTDHAGPYNGILFNCTASS